MGRGLEPTAISSSSQWAEETSQSDTIKPDQVGSHAKDKTSALAS